MTPGIALIAPTAATISPGPEGPGSYYMRLEQASLIASIENLMTFPFVRTRCEAGELALHGAYFDVATGELAALDRDSGRFAAVLGA